MKKDTSRLAGFTLVELLLVIVIMALMIGLAVPAMNSLGRANAVSSGSSQLANDLSLARAKAIASRSRVRVIFAENDNTNANVQAKTSYAMLLWTNRTADIPANWIYLDRWRHLPLGAYFITNSSFAPIPAASIPFPTNGGSASSAMPCIEFKSTGAPTSSGNIDFAIQEGTVVDGVVRSVKAANTLTNRVHAITGKVKVMK